MNFNTIAEAFNYYRNHSAADLEKRAAEIGAIIDSDPNADIKALNIELNGIKEARENVEARSQKQGNGFNVITSTAQTAKKVFDVETIADQPEYRSAFFKSMLGQKLNEVEQQAYNVGMQLAEKRADNFSTSTEVAAVLPTATLNEVISKARTMGGLMSECRAFNVPTKITIPIGTPSTKAAWHAEGAEVETDEPTIAGVSFDGYEIIKIFSISAKVRKMSIAAFEAYLVEELTACVMECIADALINGTGTEQGAGIETITWVESGANQNAIKATAAQLADWTTYPKLIALLKRGYAMGAKFACNNAFVWGTLYTLKDSNDRPIYQPDVTGQSNGKLFGFDVIVDDNVANDVLYFGNYAKYLGYNLPDGIAIEASTQSSFKKGLIDYRALAIADCKPIVSEAFVKLYKGTN